MFHHILTNEHLIIELKVPLLFYHLCSVYGGRITETTPFCNVVEMVCISLLIIHDMTHMQICCQHHNKKEILVSMLLTN